MNVMCILTDGFEELEAVGTIAFLRRAGIQVDVFALDATQATGRFDVCISEIKNLKDANLDQYGMLFLPGGPHYQKLEASKEVMSIIDDFVEKNKLIAAICAAPTILGRHGLLKHKKYTCFTSMNEDFQGTYVDQYTVTDGNIITGRSAAAVIDFAFAIIEKIMGTEDAIKVKNSIYYEI